MFDAAGDGVNFILAQPDYKAQNRKGTVNQCRIRVCKRRQIICEPNQFVKPGFLDVPGRQLAVFQRLFEKPRAQFDCGNRTAQRRMGNQLPGSVEVPVFLGLQHMNEMIALQFSCERSNKRKCS